MIKRMFANKTTFIQVMVVLHYFMKCSFHIKTNIVIPTCTSDFSPTSHYPDTHSKIFSLLLGRILLLLPVSYAQQPPTGSTGVSPLTKSILQRRQQGEQGEDGRESVRSTGRYDNIVLI